MSGTTWTARDVEAQLREAVETLRIVSDPERRLLGELKAHWPTMTNTEGESFAAEMGRDVLTEVISVAEPGAIDRMLPTLGWLQFVDKEHSKLLMAHLSGVSFERLARRLWRFSRYRRLRREALRQRYLGGLSRIARRLNDQASAGLR